MGFRVLWLSATEEALTLLWLDESIQTDVTRAADEIDRRLRRNPDQEGESRPAGRRILFVSPLAVTYKVFPDENLVVVSDVWRVRKTRGPNGSR
jgi:hypothetical protein